MQRYTVVMLYSIPHRWLVYVIMEKSFDLVFDVSRTSAYRFPTSNELECNVYANSCGNLQPEANRRASRSILLNDMN